jgi:hypothetical protein
MRRFWFYAPLVLLAATGLMVVGLLLAPDALRPPLRASDLAEVEDDGDSLPSEAKMNRLAESDPIAFLEACVRRSDREVKGYRCVLHKQERIDGKLQRSEEIAVAFREEPFAVMFEWLEGGRLAFRTLYVKGQNNDKLLVKPAGLFALAGVVERDADGADARKSGRYPLNEFGAKIGTLRTLAAWKNAVKNEAFHCEFLGEVKVKELGDRVCYKFRRTKYKEPEEADGVVDCTIYVDKETWLQTGSVVKGAEGQLLGEYFFKDLKLNPDFGDDVFTKEAVGK